MIAVRRAAVDHFGLGALSAGEPVANLRRKFVPIWLLHRYQVEAAAKLVGGVDFSYSLRGDGLEISRPVPAEAQRRAFDARSEEHTSELQSLMRTSYAVFYLTK